MEEEVLIMRRLFTEERVCEIGGIVYTAECHKKEVVYQGKSL